MKKYKTKKEMQDRIDEIDKELADIYAKSRANKPKSGCLGLLLVAFISVLFI
tara:strand:+ start:1043 stop:1198 length:156 start_codon:yes stop_codon:yes gene_type:complete